MIITDSDNILDEAIDWTKLKQWFHLLKKETLDNGLEFSDDDCLEKLNEIIKEELDYVESV